MYNEPAFSCSIISDEPPPEAQERSEDRLGGPPTVPELAPATARAQRAAMSKSHLALTDRIELEVALRAGDTQATIALRMGRASGTVSREIALNGGRDAYRAAIAHQAAQCRSGTARRGDCAIAEHPPLRDEVHVRLQRGWSPEEIAGSLKQDHPDLPRMHTSHESIYRYVYVVARGELQRELAACLRRHHRRVGLQNRPGGCESLRTCHFFGGPAIRRGQGETRNEQRWICARMLAGRSIFRALAIHR